MKKSVKIHGLMRSGTNFLEFMLRNNLPLNVMVHQGSWKHNSINPNVKCDAFALTHKNIFSWLLSIYSYAKSSKLFPNFSKDSLEAFIRKPLHFKENEIELKHDNIIQFWNQYYLKSLGANTKVPKMVFSYENFILNPQTYLKKVAKVLKIKPFPKNKYPQNSISPSHKNIVVSESFNYDKIDFYKHKAYMSSFTSKDIAYVNSVVNQELLKKLQQNDLLVKNFD